MSLIKSGETAGKIHEVSNYLADYLEKQADIKSKTMGALIYPAFLFLAVVAVFIVLFFGFPLLDLPPVIPQILSIVQEAGVEDLPLTTRSLIFINTLLLNFWYLIFLSHEVSIIIHHRHGHRRRQDLCRCRFSKGAEAPRH